jgi:hypothetical protein
MQLVYEDLVENLFMDMLLNFHVTDSDDDVPRTTNSNNNPNKSRGRYFWQYNVQAKGPKGQRLVIKTLQEDPHVLNEITDPVFSPNCSVRGIKVQTVKVNINLLGHC